MNAIVPPKPVAWSYSSLKLFNDCPKRYEQEKVLKKVKRKDTEQTLWGERGHKALEVALTTKTPLAGDFTPYQPVAERLSHIKGKFKAELQLAITNAFSPVGWFDPKVWCRGILDALWIEGEQAKVVDYKFGKRRFDQTQLKLFALLVFAHHKEVERVNTAFAWMATGQMDVEKYKREDIPHLWQDILPDVRRLETAHATGTWVPRPSGLCGYCPVSDCTFWKGFAGEKGARK